MARLSRWKKDLVARYIARIKRLERLNDVNNAHIQKLRAKIDYIYGGYILTLRDSKIEISDNSIAAEGD